MFVRLMLTAWAASGSETPNVVLLMADDQGWGDVGYNNYTQRSASLPDWRSNPPRTPNLDAMANSNHSLLFWRFYAGSAVCSPSRSAAMTGRTSGRECIDSPEPHGFGPAWSCFSPLPLSPRTTTIAEIAQAANMRTFHSGKWHLGDFFPKQPFGEESTFTTSKWPVSNPSTHGFDSWRSTEASGPSSTPNCGCEASWAAEGPGCIAGGGAWQRNQTWVCMNYWQPAPTAKTRPDCRSAVDATLDCVSNSTTKIAGDDAVHIVDAFSDFLAERAGKPPQPFLAVLWLHTIHFPRVRDSFSDRNLHSNLHSRMPLDPTHVRLKRTYV
jgi:hypothetical protein